MRVPFVLPVYIFLRTVERFENLFRFLLAETFSGVYHLNKQVAGFYQHGAVLSREMGEQFAFCLRDRADTDGYLPFRRCEFEGIGKQVEEYLFDLCFVETDQICFRQLIV